MQEVFMKLLLSSSSDPYYETHIFLILALQNSMGMVKVINKKAPRIPPRKLLDLTPCSKRMSIRMDYVKATICKSSIWLH